MKGPAPFLSFIKNWSVLSAPCYVFSKVVWRACGVLAFYHKKSLCGLSAVLVFKNWAGVSAPCSLLIAQKLCCGLRAVLVFAKRCWRLRAVLTFDAQFSDFFARGPFPLIWKIGLWLRRRACFSKNVAVAYAPCSFWTACLMQSHFMIFYFLCTFIYFSVQISLGSRFTLRAFWK